MMIELLRPAGPELARRWLAAFTMVPESEREGVVQAVERQIHAEFGAGAPPASGEQGDDDASD